MPRNTRQSGYCAKGHLPTRRNAQRFEQQREARQPARPFGFDLSNPTIGHSYPWHTNFQMTPVPEKVQMLISLGHSIVNKVSTLHAWHGNATARHKISTDAQ